MPPTNFYPNPSNPYSPIPTTTISFWKRRSVKIGILLGVLIVVIAVILLILGRIESPKNVAEQFVNETLNAQITESYQLTSSNFQTLTSLSSWKTDVQSVNSDCNGTSQVVMGSVNSKNAEEVIKTMGTSDGSCQLKIGLVLESRKWKVNSMSFTD